MLMSNPGFGHNQPPGRWIALDVGTLDHPVVGWKQPMKPADPKKKAASKCEAWIDLIRFARWKAGEANNKGHTVYLERGEMMASLPFLADRWNWTVMQVRWFLKKLEGEMMVAKVTPRPTSVPQNEHKIPTARNNRRNGTVKHNFVQHYRIENYELYQTVRELEELTANSENNSPDNRPATGEQQESIPRDTKGYHSSPDGELSLSSDLPSSEDPVAKTVREAHRLYNETAKQLGLPVARVLNKSRERSLALRIKEAGGLDGFRDALSNLGKSSFLQGQNDRGWRADLEFICQAKSFAKLMDGAYTDRNQTSNSTRRVLDELKAKKRQESNHG